MKRFLYGCQNIMLLIHETIKIMFNGLSVLMENLITWNQHSDLIRTVYNDLYQREILTDVTLVCQDQSKIKAHKVILVACSEMFKSMLCDDTSAQTKIFMKGVTEEIMINILDFMYKGEVKIAMDKLHEFLQIAQDLNMKEVGGTLPQEEKKETKVFDRKEFDDPLLPIDVGTDEQDINLEENEMSTNTVMGQKKTLEERRPFVCDKCDFRCASQKQITNHLQVKHSDLVYSCDYDNCEYKGVYISDLRKHKKEKHAKKLYPCDQCEYQGFQSGSLKVHIESVHYGLKYPCDECDTISSDRSNLRKHKLRTHGPNSFNRRKAGRPKKTDAKYYKTDQ